MSPKIFPTILIFLDLAAALVYLMDGDVKRCVYWVSAATLTYCVTY